MGTWTDSEDEDWIDREFRNVSVTDIFDNDIDDVDNVGVVDGRGVGVADMTNEGLDFCYTQLWESDGPNPIPSQPKGPDTNTGTNVVQSTAGHSIAGDGVRGATSAGRPSDRLTVMVDSRELSTSQVSVTCLK